MDFCSFVNHIPGVKQNLILNRTKTYSQSSGLMRNIFDRNFFKGFKGYSFTILTILNSLRKFLKVTEILKKKEPGLH